MMDSIVMSSRISKGGSRALGNYADNGWYYLAEEVYVQGCTDERYRG